MLLYLGTGRDHLDLRAITDVDAVIVGGEPFDEDVLVWWNFVARTRDEASEPAAPVGAPRWVTCGLRRPGRRPDWPSPRGRRPRP